MTQNIVKVHLIFKTHLDVGFTDYAREVVRHYFDEFIPGAMATAQKLRQQGKRFIWTTGSWLIDEYLDKAPDADRARLEQAIQAGDIVWHGLPFTTHSELMDAPLFAYGLSLSQQLDRRFGRRTIAGKMTDVPGHTRAIVPLLAKAGIQFLHIGVNPASTPPDVPPVFVWREPGGADVMVMYQAGSYGETMVVPGLDEAISFAHTDDNQGPQTPEQVIEAFAAVQSQFPGASVVASTLDAFAASLARIKDRLSVVTGEIGDTWIHGTGTDPAKISQFRELLRLRDGWLAKDPDMVNEKSISEFSRWLLLVPEHTWGMDIKTHLDDDENYSAEAFRAARTRANFRKVEASWAEQREYLKAAVESLDSTRAFEARQRLAQIVPARPEKTAFVPVAERAFETRHFLIGFDDTGSIIRLANRATGHDWAGADHPLARFSYQTFAQADYDRFYRQYIINKDKTASWSVPDYTKPGMASASAESRLWHAQLSALYSRADDQGQSFLLELAAPTEATVRYGCPAVLVMQIRLPEDRPVVQIDFQWFEKPASRLPEGIWLSFVPVVQNPDVWMMDKLGSPISPLDVVPNGNRYLHAVGRGVSYHAADGALEIDTFDAPLVAPGDPSLLNFDSEQPTLAHGMHFNLFNNIWGTNFPMWFDGDARFRFTLTDCTS